MHFLMKTMKAMIRLRQGDPKYCRPSQQLQIMSGCLSVWAVAFALWALVAPRCSASILYTNEVSAQTDGKTITGVLGGPSINDYGAVAFAATVPGGQSIFASTGPSGKIQELTLGNFVSPIRSFSSYLRINNASHVAGRELVSSSGTSLVQVWDATAPGNFTIIDNATATNSVVTPSINNSDQVAYLVIEGQGSDYLLSKGPLGNFKRAVSGVIRPMIADDGSIVGQEGTSPTSSIRLYASDLATYQEIADPSMGFTFLDSLPGVSRSGAIVVYQGNRGNGPGIFASVDQGNGTRTNLLIVGENSAHAPQLGVNDVGEPLYFQSFPTFTRVGVMHQQLGASGMPDDCIIVCFCATPNLPSCSLNIPLFEPELGIWTVRVDVTANAAGQLQYAVGPPKPVVQVGDIIGGQSVTALSILDPIARALTDSSGNPRNDKRGDHRIAFTASTATGAMVVQASHFTVLHGYDTLNANVNWQPLAKARMEFLIADAWGGRSRIVDAAARLNAARTNNVPIAAFCLLNFDRYKQDGLWQVRQALSAVGSERTNLAFLALDVEYGNTGFNYKYMTPAQNALQISNAVFAVTNYGLKAVIYTRQGAGGDWGEITDFNEDPFFGAIPLWLEYRNDGQDALTDPEGYIPSPPWTKVSAKQYFFPLPYNPKTTAPPPPAACEVQDIKGGGANVDLDVSDPSLFDSSNLPNPPQHTGCAADFTGQFPPPVKGPLLVLGPKNLSIRTINQSVTIKNSGPAIPGDISLAITNLTQDKAWLNLDEITSCTSAGMPPMGTPFKTILQAPASLGSGATKSVTLQFVGATNGFLAYKVLVLGGTGAR